MKLADSLHESKFKKIAVDSSKRYGITKKVRVLQNKWVAVPLSWGWFRPVIVMPKGSETWTDKRKEVVLLHELAHIKRSDFLSTIFAHTASTLYWLNPLIWLALRKFYVEREKACDDYVLSSGTKPTIYANNLLEIARSLTKAKWSSSFELSMARALTSQE